ncbi:hypothetical protein KR093_000178 [Drosophila rubida]|uniref:CLIP domain-containing serine protease n=1 Tax=Drosophila rubida TaxID=30044 RepID=A0AAD4K8T1_9MUSC|nr:hypothetical protein KR093_000178 [Drosophila rubida]
MCSLPIAILHIFTLGFSLAVQLAACGAVNIPRRRYKEHDNCGGINGFPSGMCREAASCSTLHSYYAKQQFGPLDVPTCGFKPPFGIELLCCPNTFHVPPSSQQQLGSFQGSHLVTLGYLKPITLDSYVFRCTGVLLSPTHVLATSQCVGQKTVDKPNKVLLGAEDPALYDDSQIEVAIKSTKEFQGELVLFELETALSSSQLTGNVGIARLCQRSDLLRRSNWFAIGYSYNPLVYDSCSKFAQQVQRVNPSECRDVQQQLGAHNLTENQSHLCIQPLAIYASHGGSAECSKCLAYTSSVLHVKRADGSQCVAGIATPAGDECVESNGALYFTNILTPAVQEFLQQNSVPNTL